ncbi:MAG: hypothetical protein GX111_02990 [Clostridiales bacterium]|nr:hypothetical protein [Clostridiales bacterium]
MKIIRFIILLFLLSVLAGCSIVRQTEAESQPVKDTPAGFGETEHPVAETAAPVKYVYYHYLQMYDDMCFKIGYEEGGNYSYYHEIVLDEPLQKVDSPYAGEGHFTYGYYTCTQEDEGFTDNESLWYLKEEP